MDRKSAGTLDPGPLSLLLWEAATVATWIGTLHQFRAQVLARDELHRTKQERRQIESAPKLSKTEAFLLSDQIRRMTRPIQAPERNDEKFISPSARIAFQLSSLGE